MRLSLTAILFVLLSGCTNNSGPVTRTETAMGTIVEISLWQDAGTVELGFMEIKRIEDKFSRFKEDSEISKLNKNPSAEVSGECRDLIEESIRYSKVTNGAFDVRYSANKKLDLGGIAKGYAADRVAGIFREKGIKNALINIGGNLYLLGFPPGKSCWIVGIKDPKNPEKIMAKIRLKSNVGVATSGNYERPGHIINPLTGSPSNELLGVTIIAKTATEADALSTGVFVLGREKGAKLIEGLSDVEGVIVDKDRVWVSSGLKGRYESLH